MCRQPRSQGEDALDRGKLCNMRFPNGVMRVTTAVGLVGINDASAAGNSASM